MAQRRLLNRSLGTSSKKYAKLNVIAGKLADFCHALFPLLMVNCDDHGRNTGDAFSVKNNIFPVSRHSEEDFDKALHALHEVGLISLYEISGCRYLYVHNFRREQPGIKYLARPRYPEPPPEVIKRERFTGTHQDSPDFAIEEKRSRREVEKRGRRRSRKREIPSPEILPVTDALKEWASKHIPVHLRQALDLNGETEKFLEKSRAKGWTFVDWEAARRNWLLKAIDFAQERIISGKNGKPGAEQANDDDPAKWPAKRWATYEAYWGKDEANRLRKECGIKV